MRKLITFFSVILIALLLCGGAFAYSQSNFSEDLVSNYEELGMDDSTNTQDAIQQEEYIEKEPAIAVDRIETTLNQYGLELPIKGATGFTSIELPLYVDSSRSDYFNLLQPGTAFTILREEGTMWYVCTIDDNYGWVDNTYCMINLPDVIPSIVYDNTNSYNSRFQSVSNELKGVTREALYSAIDYSYRFDEYQYIMPVLYSMAPKIAAAQQEALLNGESLKIYETFRPRETQKKVASALSELMATNEEVYSKVASYPWEQTWFISTHVSNHQKGFAMDVSLVKVTEAVSSTCGDSSYIKVTNFNEYEMPTQIHELSSLAATFTAPVASSSKTAWQSATLAPSMNEAAIKLQSYCTNHGLTPLASEWWHFNDLDTKELVGSNHGKGEFFLTKLLSFAP